MIPMPRWAVHTELTDSLLNFLYKIFIVNNIVALSKVKGKSSKVFEGEKFAFWAFLK